MDLNDKFTYFFYEFLEGNLPQKFTEKTRLSEFQDIFTKKDLKSDVTFKNNHSTRKLEDVYLQEYLPLPKTKVEQGLKFFNIDEVEV
jgi:glycosylphosphatidylinositol transamidase (GPIT) subunit GPI8